MKKQLLLGALYNALFLVAFALIYSVGLRHLVIAYDQASFLGEFWFFIVAAFVLPILFLMFGKRYLAFGGGIGIVAYLLLNSLLIGLSKL
jgi:hypothetical protein